MREYRDSLSCMAMSGTLSWAVTGEAEYHHDQTATSNFILNCIANDDRFGWTFSSLRICR